jgi:hypothetical protein
MAGLEKRGCARRINVFAIWILRTDASTRQTTPSSMDPLTALGVASSVIAFVDFAWTLIKDAREISTSGTSESVASIRSLFQNASIVNDKLASLPPAPPELQLMITESKKITTEIIDALKTLAGPQDQSKWSSFLVALRTIWAKPKIEDLLFRLDKLQTHITKYIQLSTRYRPNLPFPRAIIIC